VNRRTPVRAPGAGGPPWTLIGMFGGIVAVVLLIAYLIYSSTTGSEGLSAAEKAEQDASTDLPGSFFPTQGRTHFNYTYSPEREPRAFCEGVASADNPNPAASGTPAASVTPAEAGTPAATATTDAAPTPTIIDHTQTGNVDPAEGVPTDCYATNPPSSGNHLPSQRNVDLGNGARINIPPDPDVYPEDIFIPREAIPHILEHAGVFVGYHCADGDTACAEVVEEVKDVVNDRIDNHNDRVIMANDPDLPPGTFGVSSWTRVMNFAYGEYDEDALEDFIGTHACRFDPEGFCG
jgi:hypothetical protein